MRTLKSTYTKINVHEKMRTLKSTYTKNQRTLKINVR